MILIEFTKDRLKAGQLFLKKDQGSILFGPIAALGKADNAAAAKHGNPSRDSLKRFGDTPTGKYNCKLGPVQSPKRSYGQYKTIKLNPVGGDALQAKKNGRSGLLIHGGDPGQGGKLRPTHGCVRVHEQDMKNLIDAILHYPSEGGICDIKVVSQLSIFDEDENSAEDLNPEVYPQSEAPDSAIINTFNPFSIDTDLKETTSPLTAEIIRAFFDKRPSFQRSLSEISEAAISASIKYNINASYIVAHAIWESAWGTSTIARTKNNLFGYAAYDNDPVASAKSFASKAECIDLVMGIVDRNYLTPGGKHFSKYPCLGNKTYGMNVKYATDKGWGAGIATVARQIERFARNEMN